VGVEGIDTPGAFVVVVLERPRRLVRRGGPAGTEQDAQRPAIESADDARREAVVLRRPAALAVEVHLVRRRRSRNQTLDDHERVVVATHGERRRLVAEHGDGARRIGLDPDRGRRVADVPEQRAEEQLRHRPDVTYR
jgi:hypothetical protein